MAAVESEGRHLVAAVLGCGWPPHKTYKWSDIRRLFAYGREHFHKERLRQDICLPEIPVTGGIAASNDPSKRCQWRLKTGENMKRPEILLQMVRRSSGADNRKGIVRSVKEGQKVGDDSRYYVGTVRQRKYLSSRFYIPLNTWSGA